VQNSGAEIGDLTSWSSSNDASGWRVNSAANSANSRSGNYYFLTQCNLATCTSLKQIITPLVIGKQYQFSFYASNSVSIGTSTLRVMIGATTYFTIDSLPTVYTRYSVPFVATSASMLLNFDGRSMNTMRVDDVSIVDFSSSTPSLFPSIAPTATPTISPTEFPSETPTEAPTIFVDR
jgi:hypothetical protein